MVSPYGDGVCAYGENTEDTDEDISSRLLDSIPLNAVKASRKTCFVDEQGKCRKTLKVRIDWENDEEGSGDTGDIIDLASATTQDLVEWLQQFKRPRYTYLHNITRVLIRGDF